MKYQMIALDIDGTLVNYQQRVMPITKQMLISLQEQGIAVVLSSGRDLYSLERIGQMIDLAHYPQSGYISLNGLEIYDSQSQLLHQEKKLQKEDVIVLESITQEYQLDMILFFYHHLYIIENGHTHIIDQHFMTTPKDKILHVSEIPSSLFDDLRKVAFVQHQDVIRKILPSLHERMDSDFEMTLVEPDWIEINPLGLNKGQALCQLAQIKNIPLSQVIAFGNGENDIEMLKVAGCGVAMGNSFDIVKANADDVCGHCEEDGIGRYLQNIE